MEAADFSMERPGALVLVWLSWVLRGGSDNVDAAADADATFPGPARPVWGPESVRWGRGWGCPGSWAGAEFERGGGWPPVRSTGLGRSRGIPQGRPGPPGGGGCGLRAGGGGRARARGVPGRPGPK